MLSSITVVIPNWNLKDYTIACIESLINAGAAAAQIIVVDDGSTDGSPQALAQRFGPELHILVNEQNLGFVGASNRGMAAAYAQGATWALLLNNDTYVANDFFQNIEAVLQRQLPYQIYAPLIFYHDHPTEIWHAGARQVGGFQIWRNLYKDQPTPNDLPEVMPVDQICGCAMLVHRSVYEQVGFFYPKLFGYWEEVDFCWRAAQAGFKAAIITGAHMWHHVSKSFKQDQPRARYLAVRNQLRFYRTHAKGLRQPVMILFFMYKQLPRLLGDMLHGRKTLLQATLKGMRDGWPGF
jgi:GT2 family glycosyltransferase